MTNTSEKYERTQQGNLLRSGWLLELLTELITIYSTSFQGYKTPGWASVWDQYRNCTEKPKIIHKNGSFWSAS